MGWKRRYLHEVQPSTRLRSCILRAHNFRCVDALPCAAAIPEADKLKAVVDDILQKHEQELSKQASKLQKMQGQASTTQGALTACQTQLNQQQHEVETLQNSVQASLSQIYNMVRPSLLNLRFLVVTSSSALVQVARPCKAQPLLPIARNETPTIAFDGP